MSMHCKNKRLRLLIRPIMISRGYPKEGRMSRQRLLLSTKISSVYPYINWHDQIVDVFLGLSSFLRVNSFLR